MSWNHLKRWERSVLAPLFADHRASFLIDAVVEGHLGDAMVDDPASPNVAMLVYADVAVFGGDAGHPRARRLAEQLPEERAVLPSSEAWHAVLTDVHGDLLVPIERFAFSDKALDAVRLRQLASNVPTGYEVRRIDERIAELIVADPSLISPDHVRHFDSPVDFVERGIGYCAVQDGVIVAGASSYAICDAGIEVQVNTHESHRGNGLATVLSARLIAEVLDQGLAAHWDAANEISSRLAVKLGYTPTSIYVAWVRIPADG